jgi:hypothetical protein
MPTLTDTLLRNKRAAAISLGAVGLTGMVLLIVGAIGYLHSWQQRTVMQHINARMTSISRISDRQAAISELEGITDEAKKLDLNLPEAEYARLWHAWQSAVDDFKQITAALNNRYLAVVQQQRLQTFHAQLLALRDSCTATLEGSRQLPASLGWKLHNLKANVSVMLAYSVLTFEQDGRKAAKFLSDAVDDYKISIDLVDQIPSSSLERSLPRWNMELIVGLGEYRRLGLSEIPQENMTDVQEQLEAFIPDVAGFAPGVPLETRVEK